MSQDHTIRAQFVLVDGCRGHGADSQNASQQLTCLRERRSNQVGRRHDRQPIWRMWHQSERSNDEVEHCRTTIFALRAVSLHASTDNAWRTENGMTEAVTVATGR